MKIRGRELGLPSLQWLVKNKIDTGQDWGSACCR